MNFKVNLNDNSENFYVSFLDNSEDISIDFGIITQAGSGIPYNGPYDVTPKVDESYTLKTKGFSMRDNVTVKEVQHYEVSNQSGGSTFIIT